jgi:hypothetical protein
MTWQALATSQWCLTQTTRVSNVVDDVAGEFSGVRRQLAVTGVAGVISSGGRIGNTAGAAPCLGAAAALAERQLGGDGQRVADLRFAAPACAGTPGGCGTGRSATVSFSAGE